ncbi:MAG TPA: universal stress protein, partial [Candidatus Thermoplasmatota archaeon]|nr:universal stress protein [Candidatus Thermoplasmatota archaeon]
MTARPVLLATDLSEGARRAAAALRHVAEPGAPVHVLHVVPDRPRPETTEAARREATEWMERAGLAGATLHVAHGDPARFLAQQGAALDASLVALGSTGAGRFERALLGSVAR